MLRATRLAYLIVVVALLPVAAAAAQAPAVDQYTNTGSSAPPPTPLVPPAAATPPPALAPPGSVAGERAAGVEPGARRAAPGGAPGAGIAGARPGPRCGEKVTLRISFGRPSDRLAREIDAALRQGGITPSAVGHTSKRRVERFLSSRLAGRLTEGDAEATGRAVGRLVVDPGPLTPAVLRALLGRTPVVCGRAISVTQPATHAVFTRFGRPTREYAAFQKGLVDGSSAVRRAYAEMSASRRSFVEDFAALGIPTVDNVETQAGKAALVAILVSGAEGNFGAKPTADTKLVQGEVRPLSVRAGVGPGAAATSYGLLGLLVLTVLWSALGRRPRRRRA